MREQPLLRLEPPRIPGERTTLRDHAMTRNDDRDRVRAVRGSHRATRRWSLDRTRELAVRPRRAVRDREQLSPHALLKAGASRTERELERLAVAREVFGELTRGLRQDRRRALGSLGDGLHGQVEPHELVVLREQAQRAEG